MPCPEALSHSHQAAQWERNAGSQQPWGHKSMEAGPWALMLPSGQPGLVTLCLLLHESQEEAYNAGHLGGGKKKGKESGKRTGRKSQQ